MQREARTETPRLQRELDRALAPIKSYSELQSYLQTFPMSASPLNKLSPAARKRFLDSLQFNEKGLTTFRSADLESELSVSEIYAVLSLFGEQSIAGRLFRGARVSS